MAEAISALAFNALQLVLGLHAFRLDGESRPLWAMPLQQFVYKHLMYLGVLESLASALTGARVRWHSPDRTGQIKWRRHPKIGSLNTTPTV